MLGFFYSFIFEENLSYEIRYLSFTPIFFIYCWNIFSQERTLNAEKLKAFDAFVLQEIEANNIAGAEVYIVQNEETVWHSALGNKNMQTQAALEKNSIYYIQSMTKPIISTAIMQLVEQG